MFEQYDAFEQIDDKALLWRYQDLPRYFDLLLKNKLFFCRIDKYEDPFEGMYNKKTATDFLEKHQSVSSITTGKNETEKLEEISKKQNEKRTFVTANSWHENNSENFAMWKIYAKGSYGIALQTSYKRLKDCFHVTDKPIHIGKVNYYNESCDMLSKKDNNTLLPFLSKRHIYEYEKEIRCCYLIDEDKTSRFDWDEQDTLNGVFIPVDLNEMIERIYISPYSPKWIRDIVEGITKKFKLDKEIVHSSVFDSIDY